MCIFHTKSIELISYEKVCYNLDVKVKLFMNLHLIVSAFGIVRH